MMWEDILNQEKEKPYFTKLLNFVEEERSLYSVYPPSDLIFNAMKLAPYEKVKVVIVGQDPYHGPGQAHGLSFSVPKGVKPPPSLVNIFKELKSDLNIDPPKHGCLIPWAEQGVLLLNTTLTVREAYPASHHGQGWEQFTDVIIEKLANKPEPIVFLLWGKNAIDKCRSVPHGTKNFILTAPHPSPFSCYKGFLGCKHFSKANQFLISKGVEPINWKLI